MTHGSLNYELRSQNNIWAIYSRTMLVRKHKFPNNAKNGAWWVTEVARLISLEFYSHSRILKIIVFKKNRKK